MANLSLRTAEQLRVTISKRQQQQINRLYSNMAQDIKGQIDRINLSPDPSAAEALKRLQLKQLADFIAQAQRETGQQVNQLIRENLQATSHEVVNDVKRWMDRAGLTIKGAYAYVPAQTVEILVSGQLYRRGWTLSRAIWGAGQKVNRDVRSIVAAGIAANKSALEIAQDLEKYVDPSAKKRWDWSKVYPGTATKIDYNAQRLARTMVSHAYQQSLLLSTKDNPFITGYRWRAAFSVRTCQLCRDRDGNVYSADKLPLDHPNGLCTFLCVIPDSMNNIADRLADWANGSRQDPALDRWHQAMQRSS